MGRRRSRLSKAAPTRRVNSPARRIIPRLGIAARRGRNSARSCRWTISRRSAVKDGRGSIWGRTPSVTSIGAIVMSEQNEQREIGLCDQKPKDEPAGTGFEEWWESKGKFWQSGSARGYEERIAQAAWH